MLQSIPEEAMVPGDEEFSLFMLLHTDVESTSIQN